MLEKIDVLADRLSSPWNPRRGIDASDSATAIRALVEYVRASQGWEYWRAQSADVGMSNGERAEFNATKDKALRRVLDALIALNALNDGLEV